MCCAFPNTRAHALEQSPLAYAQYCVRGGRACPCARLAPLSLRAACADVRACAAVRAPS